MTAVDTLDIPITVSGRVVSQSGTALAGATVTLGGQTVTTDAKGEFVLSNVNLSAGNKLTIGKDGFASHQETAPVQAGSVSATWNDFQIRKPLGSTNPISPAVYAVRPGYSFNLAFLPGVPFLNPCDVVVDWNGLAPGSVEFYANDTLTQAVPAGNEDFTYARIDMGSGFVGSFTPRANLLKVVAIDSRGTRSDPFEVDVKVIPTHYLPAWSALPYDSQYDQYHPSLFGNVPDYQLKINAPSADAPTLFSLPVWRFGQLDLNIGSDAIFDYWLWSGEWLIRRESPFALFLNPGGRGVNSARLSWGDWRAVIDLIPAASGHANSESGLNFDHVNLGYHFDTKGLLYEVLISDYIPPIEWARVFDVLRPLGVDLNNIQRFELFGLVSLDADLQWSYQAGQYNQAVLTPGGGLQAYHAPSLLGLSVAELEMDITGTLSFPLQVIPEKAWKVEGQISAGFKAKAFGNVYLDDRWVLVEGEIASSGNWGAAGSPMFGRAATESAALRKVKTTYPRPMERDYLNAGLPQFLARDSSSSKNQDAPASASQLDIFRQISRAPVKGSVAWEDPALRKRNSPTPAPRFDGSVGETNQVDLTLLQNVFPLSTPALDARGQELMLLFVTDNGRTNRTQFTDIGWTHWDGTNWTSPAAIRTNTQGEFAPQVKFDGNGDAIAVWQRVADPNFTNLNLNALAAQMEIVWSRWSSTNGVWSEPLALTANSHLDNLPLLCGPMSNGKVLLTWTENEHNLLMGTNGPGADKVRWCEWSPASRSWTAPQTLLEGLAYRLSQSLAGRGNYAAYAWTLDGDGVLTSDVDQEVFYVTYTNGTWTSPSQFTTNGVADKNVRLAVSSGGDAYLFWQRETNLVLSRNFSPTNQLARANSSSASFADYALTLGPAGNLVLLWQAPSTNGSDAHYAVYDPVSDVWSKDGLLSQDASLERSFAPVWDDVGNLTVAYNKVEILHTNKTVELEGGSQITLTNLPQWGRVDLVVTKRGLIKDLAIEAGGFHAAGVNYLPGDPLRLEAIVRNLGNDAVSNVVVGFYDGSPDAGGVLLTNVTLSGWLGAVASTAAEAVWVVPEPAAPHVLFAVVNHASLASEFNEANNFQSVSIGGTDLAVSLVSYQAEINGAVRVFAKVQNLGAPAAVNSVLAIRREGSTGAPLVTTTVPALEPGQLAQVALDLPAGTQPEGAAAYRLFADDTHANSDVNTSNNVTAIAVSLWLDADRDGMPDGWESRYPFLSSGNAGDASLDYDGDGLSNLAEYLAGTLPDDPLSYLRLTSISTSDVNGVQITWGSAASKLYSVQRSSALGSVPAFTNLAEHLPSTPPENSYLDATATNSAAFFYRIRIE